VHTPEMHAVRTNKAKTRKTLSYIDSVGVGVSHVELVLALVYLDVVEIDTMDTFKWN
jgi:hypothetical protein